MLYDFEIYQFSRSFVYWFLLRYNCFSYNIIFFGLKLLGWVSRWQTCVLTAKHKAALLYYKKAFRNTYQNDILKYSLQNVYPKLDFCWASSSGLYYYLFKKRVHFQKEPSTTSFVFFKSLAAKWFFLQQSWIMLDDRWIFCQATLNKFILIISTDEHISPWHSDLKLKTKVKHNTYYCQTIRLFPTNIWIL